MYLFVSCNKDEVLHGKEDFVLELARFKLKPEEAIQKEEKPRQTVTLEDQHEPLNQINSLRIPELTVLTANEKGKNDKGKTDRRSGIKGIWGTPN